MMLIGTTLKILCHNRTKMILISYKTLLLLDPPTLLKNELTNQILMIKLEQSKLLKLNQILIFYIKTLEHHFLIN